MECFFFSWQTQLQLLYWSPNSAAVTDEDKQKRKKNFVQESCWVDREINGDDEDNDGHQAIGSLYAIVGA